jgi:hypothetical protein
MKVYTIEEWFTELGHQGYVTVHIVESLPEQMLLFNNETTPIYIIESTGVGYVSETGNSVDAYPLSGTPLPETYAPDMGIVDSMDGINQQGYYFCPGMKNKSVHTHDSEGWVDYINYEKYNKVVQEKIELEAGNASLLADAEIMSVKYNAVEECVTEEAVLNFVTKTNLGISASYGGVKVVEITDKNITSIKIPTGVSEIGSSAFNDCKNLASVILPNGLKYINSTAFNGCYALNTITLPEGLLGLGSQVFNNCSSLTSMVIPNGITRTYSMTFGTCPSLKSIIFPASITKVGAQTFYGCSALEYIDFSVCISVPEADTSYHGVYYGLPTSCKIIVPDDLYDVWVVASGWSSEASRIVKASDVV